MEQRGGAKGWSIGVEQRGGAYGGVLSTFALCHIPERKAAVMLKRLPWTHHLRRPW